MISLEKQPKGVLYKKAVLKNFANVTGKHLCFRPATVLKSESNTDVFL